MAAVPYRQEPPVSPRLFAGMKNSENDFPWFNIGLFSFWHMKITVDIPDNDMKDIMRFSGEKKKSPAIVKFLASGLMLRRRREFSDEVMSGKIRLEFPHYESILALDRKSPWDN